MFDGDGGVIHPSNDESIDMGKMDDMQTARVVEKKKKTTKKNRGIKRIAGKTQRYFRTLFMRRSYILMYSFLSVAYVQSSPSNPILCAYIVYPCHPLSQHSLIDRPQF